MRAAKKTVDNIKILQELVPLNALSDDRFAELAEKIVIEVVKSGRYLFRRGDRDNRTLYLLDGKLGLLDENRKVTRELVAGSDECRHPILNQQPRAVTVRVSSKAVIASIDSSMLDAFLTWDQSNTADAVELDAEDAGHWMTRLLKSETFRKLPPSKLQGVLVRMKPFEVAPGEVIIRQGEEGDFFYTIDEGVCMVSRQAADGTEQVLAELAAGDSFGEEALVSSVERNASVTMKTAGRLMRLAKEDFDELLKTQHLKYLDFAEAEKMVEEGAVWIDVRTPDEYARRSLEDSVNLPLASLRGEIPELVYNASYIICCDTGRRSDSAAFILSHRGFNVYVLDGGLATIFAKQAQADGPQAADNVVAMPDSAVPSGREAGKAAADDGAIAALRDENSALQTARDTLEQQLGRQTENASNLSGQVEQLRDELAESSQKQIELTARLDTQAQERAALEQRLQSQQAAQDEELDGLRKALADEQARAAGLEQQLRAGAMHAEEQSLQSQEDRQALIAGKQQLTGELTEARGRIAALERDLQAAATQQTSLGEQLEQARADNGRLEEQVATLQGDTARLQNRLSGAEHDGQARSQEHDRDLNNVRSELQRLQQQLADAERTITSLRTEKTGLEASRESVTAALEVRTTELQEQLAGSRRQEAEQSGVKAALEADLRQVQDELDSAGQTIEALRAENAELVAGNESVNQSLQARTTELQEQQAAAQRQAAEQAETHARAQAALEAELQQVRDDLAAASDALTASRSEAAGLQQQHADASRDLQAARAAGQAGDEKLAQVEAEKAALRAEMEAALATERDANAALQQQLAAREAEHGEAVAELQQQHAQASAEFAAVQSDLSAQLEDFHKAQHEWEALQARLEQERDALTRQAEEAVVQHKQQTEALMASADKRYAELQVLLEREQQRGLQAEQRIDEKTQQLATLEKALADADAAHKALDRELAQVRVQLDESREILAQREARAEELEAEHAESLRKSHDELTRKNDTEKELQGQIDRLRKKLEQVSQDNQKSRESAIDDLDALREQLHQERQARAEERAQMAARQRELKEQLATIAAQHEEHITDRSGANEAAHDAAREEERLQMQAMQESHAEVEQQLTRVQAELQQAHEEIARLDQREKARRQAEIDTVSEQNEQAESAIMQLEGQLRQLTRERDSAVEEQHELRVRMTELRADVEAATTERTSAEHALAGDMERLRGELADAQKDIDTARHKQADAEAERERLAGELAEMRAWYDEATRAEVLQVPSLDVEQLDDLAPPVPLAPAPAVQAPSRVSAWLARQRAALAAATRRTVRAVVTLLLVAVAGFTAWKVHEHRDAIVVSLIAAIGGDSGAQAGRPDAQVSAPVSADAAPRTTDQLNAPDLQDGQPAASSANDIPAAVGTVFRDTLKSGGNGPSMLSIRDGSYLMGSPANSLNFDEGPRHTVNLRGFAISTHEVSFAEYERFARATGRPLPHDKGWGRGSRPVINVSWHDALAYTKWLSQQTGKRYRLPSEAEWEYAARAGSAYSYWWSDLDTTGVQANCFDCGSRWDNRQTAPVGSFAANRYGLHDMSGNVQEWTADCYHSSYHGAPADGSAWVTPGCNVRVVRGGAYTSPLDSLRSAKRSQLGEETRLDNVGFRVVREL